MSSVIYLGIMLAVICIWFLLVKRPVYEAVLLSFLVLVGITNTWSEIWGFIDDAMSDRLMYSMVAFIAMSVLLTKTKIIDNCVALILAVVGRVPGGAGYTAVVSSAFLGALSGSGPGNVMATGAITIPAMKKSGFPAELAANIESNASYMGNMIPPSSNILAAMSALAAAAPFVDSNVNITDSQFWTIMWGIALYFILQRLLMVFLFCKYYKVKPMSKQELPGLKQTFKTCWRGLLLPVIILAPFILDRIFGETFFVQRLGEAGAKAFSKSVVYFVGGLTVICACFLVKDKSMVTPKAMSKMFAGAVKSIVPAIAVCLFGYMIGSLFDFLGAPEQLKLLISGLEFGKLGMVTFICLITCFMGMVIPGSALVKMCGTTFIVLLYSVGVNPILAAAMLPCICGVMCGITPPMALGMYAGMSIAGSDFGKTVKNDLWWVAAQFILQVVVLMGFLPIMGL